MWATYVPQEGCEEFIIFVSSLGAAFPLPVAICMLHSSTPDSPWLQKIVLPDVLHCFLFHRHVWWHTTPISSHRIFIKCSDIIHCCFVHRQGRIFFTYSESSWLGGSKHTNFSSLCWTEHLSFKSRDKTNVWCLALSGTRNLNKPVRSFFAALNNDCSAQERHREPNSRWSEPSWGFWIYENKFSSMSVKKGQRKKSERFKWSMCDEISVCVCVPSGLLAVRHLPGP